MKKGGGRIPVFEAEIIELIVDRIREARTISHYHLFEVLLEINNFMLLGLYEFL